MPHSTVPGGFFNESKPLLRALEKELLNFPDPERCRKHLEKITSIPHCAGTVQGKAVANYVSDQLMKSGLLVSRHEFQATASFPVSISVSLVVNKKKTSLGRIEDRKMPEDFPEENPYILPWCAYSASGELEGKVVYANYGRAEDFQILEKKKISLKDKIVLVRYGKGYRGSKVFEAQNRNAAAVLLYPDPADSGSQKGKTYPDGPWAPDDCIQRGSVLYDFLRAGDPGRNANNNSEEEKVDLFPTIPVVPISARDAGLIMKSMKGKIPDDWKGGLEVPYSLGPGPSVIQLDVMMETKTRTFINILGVIRGEEEPHRFVLISNHHDAWTYGAVDPGTGTAAMLELANTFGNLRRIGWKPRRSLIFGFWDGEEYALTGSTAWGEEEAGRMRECLACLNVDAAVSGDNFFCATSPLLAGLVKLAASKVRLPGGKWMGSFFKYSGPDNAENAGKLLPGNEPLLMLSGGTDYTVFFNRMGVPSIDVGFTGPYGVYHSMYDDFEWVKKFGDPGFLYHTAMVKFIGLMALHLSESDLLPYDVLAYPRAFREHLDLLPKKSKIAEIMEKAADSWDEAANEAHAAIQKIKQNPPGAAREKAKIINEALLSIERSLLDKEGIPSRKWFRHLIYAPKNTFEPQVFPAVMDSLDQGKRKDAVQHAEKIAAAVDRVCVYLRKISKINK